jgi:ssDNA-binding Zn-finger/Zn-ribbon topoisomerase 1
MALRCSLTGHDWGDVRTEVDREEGLDEVAITEVEYRECERCGETDVLTENTEVTAMRSASDRDDGTEEQEGEARQATADAASDGGTQHVATGDDAVIIDAEAEAASAAEGERSDGGGEGESDDERRYVGTGVDGDAAPPVDDGTYRCPDCGFSEAAATSSLRPGDLCPRCGDGYLDEQD